MLRTFRPTRLASALLFAAGLAGAAHAATITREFSSVWFDPAKSGHGLGLEVIEGASGKELLAYWFTYDAQGKQMWVFGTAPITGDTVRMTAYVTSGGRFDGGFNPSAVRSAAWGTLEFSFADCDTGTLRYTPNDAGAPRGTMSLTRLTRLFNSNCTGGISDDRAVSAAPVRTTEFLVNRGAYPAASARVRFEDRSDRTEFSIELEDLPVGNYTLRVDDATRGTVSVVAIARGTEGELEFRSPVEPGKLLLDFDPRGAIIEVLEGNRVLFDSVLDDSGNDTPPTTGNPPRPGNGRYELVLEPQGNDGPELDAKLEQRQDRVDFSVELEDVAAGAYTLQVGGVARGSIDVVRVPGGTEGEIEYRNPVEPGKFVLDFDPRGAQIVVTFNGATVFSGTFPTTPGSTPSGNGNDDDNPGDDNGGGGDDDGPGDDNGGDDDDDGPGDDNGGDDDDDGPGDDNGGDDDDDGPGDDNGGDDDDDGPGDDNGGDDDDDGPGDDNGGDDDDDGPGDDNGGDDDDDGPGDDNGGDDDDDGPGDDNGGDDDDDDDDDHGNDDGDDDDGDG